MNIKLKSLLIILIALVLSCKNQNNVDDVQAREPDEIEQKENPNPEIKITTIDKNAIIEQVQGKWKEIEYPFRTAEFVNSTVKFVEEGTANHPAFEVFDISNECPFDNNNIRDLTPGDIMLTLPETNRCEKLQLTNDTLTLSGFSSNTNEDYHIIYLKLK